MNYILGVDLGTTALKVSLFDEEGKLLALPTKEYKLLTPTTLAVELEIGTYWNAFKEGIAEVLKLTKISPEKIKALGISAQGETLILVDKDGKPLRNAIVWLTIELKRRQKSWPRNSGTGLVIKLLGRSRLFLRGLPLKFSGSSAMRRILLEEFINIF